MVKADIRIAAKGAAKAGETAASIVRDFALQQTADCQHIALVIKQVRHVMSEFLGNLS